MVLGILILCLALLLLQIGAVRALRAPVLRRDGEAHPTPHPDASAPHSAP